MLKVFPLHAWALKPKDCQIFLKKNPLINMEDVEIEIEEPEITGDPWLADNSISALNALNGCALILSFICLVFLLICRM
jgi:hypothetical protein